MPSGPSAAVRGKAAKLAGGKGGDQAASPPTRTSPSEGLSSSNCIKAPVVAILIGRDGHSDPNALSQRPAAAIQVSSSFILSQSEFAAPALQSEKFYSTVTFAANIRPDYASTIRSADSQSKMT